MTNIYHLSLAYLLGSVKILVFLFVSFPFKFKSKLSEFLKLNNFLAF